MKKLFALFLGLCLLLSFAGAEEAAGDPAENDIVILFTNDVHCGIDEGWGYAGLYAAREYYRASHKEGHVFLVDSGDAIQGEAIGLLTTGEAIIDLLNAMQYDVVTIGNHEFDYGVKRLEELVEKAEYPYVCCNYRKDGKQVFPPYRILEADGVKIAFVGVVTPLTLRSSGPVFTHGGYGESEFDFAGGEDGKELYDTVQKAVDDARAEGADYVILLSHLGNQAESGPFMYNKVIENTTGIDAVLDGHSHDTDQTVVKNREGKDVVRSSTGTKLANIGVLTITEEGKISAELLMWHADAGAQALLGLKNPIADKVNGVNEELAEHLAEVVAETPNELCVMDPTAVKEDGSRVRIVRQAETNLGDLVADALLRQAGDGDFAMINAGGVRDTLYAGEITRKDVIRVQPYLNYVVTAELSGQQVLDALEWSVHAVPGEFGGFLQVSGLTYEMNAQIPSPAVEDEDGLFVRLDETKERRVSNVLVNGEPIDPGKTYRVVSSDYLYQGGDGYTMLSDPKIVGVSDKLTYQAVTDFLKDDLGGVVGAEYENPYGQGRIVSVQAGE